MSSYTLEYRWIEPETSDWSEWEDLFELPYDTLEDAKEDREKERSFDEDYGSDSWVYQYRILWDGIVVETDEFENGSEKILGPDSILVEKSRWDELTAIELRLTHAMKLKKEEVETWERLIGRSDPKSAQRFRYGQLKNDAVRELAELKSFIRKEA